MSPEARSHRITLVFAILAVTSLLASILFMTLGARGSWSFVLPFRGVKLAGLLLVAVAIALSTVIFQTIVNNRILTPSLMGFDALYALLQTILVFIFGAAGVSGFDKRLMFVAETGAMLLFASLLYRWLFATTARSLHLLLLVGIVFGVLFRSISGFLQRIIDPTEFLILQDRLFASFNSIDPVLLTLSAAILGACCTAIWWLLPKLDVLALGREHAIALGINHHLIVSGTLLLVILLVAISTALVGPVSFFGLLVANLAYLLMPTARHAVLLPTAALLAIIFLVGGQTILERVFGFDTALSVVIEFAGGIVFLLLVIRGAAR
ncbi:iron chelate uptake ABC transporter family permease subunit [Aquamicrobium segne]|uniref:Iron chelate uptake ABC transporter family permease subunit n=1 Tax=Aquamicrobium segne TaxID=469547 RepID=A0ABW0H278_9HYPH